MTHEPLLEIPQSQCLLDFLLCYLSSLAKDPSVFFLEDMYPGCQHSGPRQEKRAGVLPFIMGTFTSASFQSHLLCV